MAGLSEQGKQDIKEAVQEGIAAQGACPNCSRLEAELEKELAKPYELPPFDSVIEHCENCAGHKPQLDKYLEQKREHWLQNLTNENVAEIAQHHGLISPSDIPALTIKRGRRK